MIGLINYGSGNIFAIANIYKMLDIPFKMIDDPKELKSVDKLILPGVGAFDETMNLLNEKGLKDELDELVLVKKTPIIGVCVGMQILSEGSEEGIIPGFGWVKGNVKKIDESQLEAKPYLPHLGWNSITLKQEHPLFAGVDCNRGFYFLHTYYFETNREDNVLTTSRYGKTFASAVINENIIGVQFHPEKSHSNGIQLFKNYANL